MIDTRGWTYGKNGAQHFLLLLFSVSVHPWLQTRRRIHSEPEMEQLWHASYWCPSPPTQLYAFAWCEVPGTSQTCLKSHGWCLGLTAVSSLTSLHQVTEWFQKHIAQIPCLLNEWPVKPRRDNRANGLTKASKTPSTRKYHQAWENNVHYILRTET